MHYKQIFWLVAVDSDGFDIGLVGRINQKTPNSCYVVIVSVWPGPLLEGAPINYEFVQQQDSESLMTDVACSLGLVWERIKHRP